MRYLITVLKLMAGEFKELRGGGDRGGVSVGSIRIKTPIYVQQYEWGLYARVSDGGQRYHDLYYLPDIS